MVTILFHAEVFIKKCGLTEKELLLNASNIRKTDQGIIFSKNVRELMIQILSHLGDD